MRIIKDFLFIPLLLICSLAYGADPSGISISANLTDGSDGIVFVASGSNFGTKSTAAPIVFDDFDSGSADANWSYWSGSVQDHQTIQNTTAKSGYALEGTYTSGGSTTASYCASFESYAGGGQNQYWYVSFWYRKNFTWGDAGDAKFGNYKCVRFNDGDQSSSANAYCEIASPDRAKRTIESSDVDGVTYFNFDRDAYIPSNDWVFIERYDYVHADSGGIQGFRVSGDTIYNESGLDYGPESNLQMQFIGFYNARDSANYANENAWLDEVYVDKTWARILIGNNVSYANCTEFHMQIPSAWATDSITFTCNLSSALPETENWYLYVVNSGNEVNATGILVSEGGGGTPGTPDTTPPNIGGKSPISNATGVLQATDIDFTLSDDLSGVNLDWVTQSGNMSISGVDYASSVTSTGDSSSLVCTLPNASVGVFTPGEVVTVGVNTKDENANEQVYEWSFTVEDNTVRWGGETLTLNGETLTLP